MLDSIRQTNILTKYKYDKKLNKNYIHTINKKKILKIPKYEKNINDYKNIWQTKEQYEIQQKEIPYCQYRMYKVQYEIMVENKDQIAQKEWGSCIVYLSSFLHRYIYEYKYLFINTKCEPYWLYILSNNNKNQKTNEYDKNQKRLNEYDKNINRNTVYYNTQNIIKNIGKIWQDNIIKHDGIDIIEGIFGISMIPEQKINSELYDIYKKISMNIDKKWEDEQTNISYKRHDRNWWDTITLIVTLYWIATVTPINLLQLCIKQVIQYIDIKISWLIKSSLYKRKCCKIDNISISKRLCIEECAKDTFNVPEESVQLSFSDVPCRDAVKSFTQDNNYKKIIRNLKLSNSDISSRDSKLHMQVNEHVTIDYSDVPSRDSNLYIQDIESPTIDYSDVPSRDSKSYTQEFKIIKNNSIYQSTQKEIGRATLSPNIERRIYCVTHIIQVCSEFGTRPILPCVLSYNYIKKIYTIQRQWQIDICDKYPLSHLCNREIILEVASCILICKYNGIILDNEIIHSIQETFNLCFNEYIQRGYNEDLRNTSNDPKCSVYIPWLHISQPKTKRGRMFANYHIHYLISLFFILLIMDTAWGDGMTIYPPIKTCCSGNIICDNVELQSGETISNTALLDLLRRHKPYHLLQ